MNERTNVKMMGVVVVIIINSTSGAWALSSSSSSLLAVVVVACAYVDGGWPNNQNVWFQSSKSPEPYESSKSLP